MPPRAPRASSSTLTSVRRGVRPCHVFPECPTFCKTHQSENIFRRKGNATEMYLGKGLGTAPRSPRSTEEGGQPAASRRGIRPSAPHPGLALVSAGSSWELRKRLMTPSLAGLETSGLSSTERSLFGRSDFSSGNKTMLWRGRGRPGRAGAELRMRMRVPGGWVSQPALHRHLATT